MPPLERQLPLAGDVRRPTCRYGRTLVHYLRRRREEQPQYQVTWLT